ncbi:ataxin-2 isoform X5 [Bufo gargarizans]|uniref:ataxin-2 isoform X5 n=1 Tax=Bufo gargarizans TaxID=30331 RepID=UPI001CF4022F|nr:ataxin-2 isoform X5 [Bufo gargarizans]
MSMKQTGNNRKPGGANVPAPGGGGRQNMGRGRSSGKGPPQSISFDGIYANTRMVHILTSVVGSKCEVHVKNSNVYEGVFKTYSPKCDLVLDAAHKKNKDFTGFPKREDIVDSILFKASDFVMVQFKDMDVNYAKRDGFTDSGISSKVNGEHKEKDLEPWDGGDGLITSSLAANTEELESLDTDVFNGWDPNEMFRYNEENYGVVSTYDSSLSSYTVPLERDNSEEYLKREARAAQIAEEIESSSQYKARVALENDERSEEEKYTAVQRNVCEREGHSVARENKYVPPGQRNKDGMSWNSHGVRQNSPRMGQSGSGPIPSRTGSHSSDFSPNSGPDQRIVNGGPLRMSPKAQRHPRTHRVSNGRSTMVGGLEFVSRNEPGEVSAPPVARNSSSGGTWSSVVSGVQRLSPKTHRPRSPRQSAMGGATGPVVSSPQAGSVASESVTMPVPTGSPTPASPASNRAVTPSNEAKDSRLQDQRQISPAGGRESIKQSDSSTFSKPENKVVSPLASEQRKQLDDLKKFKNDFRLQSSSSPDAIDQLLGKNRENLEKPRELLKDKSDSNSKESASESGSNAPTSNSSSKPSSPSISPSISSSGSEHKRGPEVTSQGVQTSGPGKQDREDKDEKKENASEQVRKSTLNPNAKEFNPRSYAQPKPSTTPTSPRPQAQPSPSMVGHQQPTPVYTQPVCFAPNMMYPVPVSPGVQPLYPIQMTMPVNQAKTYRAGKVQNMPQQRQDQHHQNTMMHPVSAAGPPMVATSPAYSAQYVTYSPQQFPSQPLMQHVQHYQSQHPHVYSPVIQGNSRMMAPPGHAQAGLVSSSATQYGAPEQTHAMYACPKIPNNKETAPSFYFAISTSSLAQQYAHPSAALHPHPPHPQPSATPTGQQQSQHGGSHPAPSPVQHHQHQAAQALHLANQQQQNAIYHTGLAPTPPSMTPGSNAQSPQNSFPTQQTVFTIHPSHVQTAYTNPPHMAHVQQAHVQSGMVPSHPTAHPMMLMTAQPPGGPQAALAQSALQPIPVSTTAHFPYMTHPPVQAHHQQQL